MHLLSLPCQLNWVHFRLNIQAVVVVVVVVVVIVHSIFCFWGLRGIK